MCREELEALPDDAGGALGRAILMFREAEAALEQEKKQHAITKHAYDDVSQTLKEAEAENAALIQTSGDLCEACGWRGKRGGSCAFCENAALRAERNELLHQQQNGYPSVEEVGIEGLRQHIKGLEAERDDLKRKGELLCQAYGEHLIEHGSGGRCGAERDRLRQSRDGMLREAVRALEHWLAKGAKVVWTPYLTPSACRELLRAAGFYGADQLEHARAALASGEESREKRK